MKLETSRTALLRRILRLERLGRYTEALDRICAHWRDTDCVPEIDGLDTQQTAEFLLRAGSLLGRAGHNEGIQGSQERSRDLLTRAREVFLQQEDHLHAVEAEFLLAYSYSRTGEYVEAHAWLDNADTYDIPATSEESLTIRLIRSLVLMSERRHEENVVLCRSIEPLFREFGSALLNGALSTNIALSLKDVGRFDEALDYLNLSRAFHQRAKHQVYLATVENNLAMLYKDKGQFDLAHLSVDVAISIYRKLRDRTRQGSSLDTKAQIYLCEGKLDLAQKSVDRSIKILGASENLAYLAESLATKAQILIQRDRFADAILALTEAVDLTRRQSGDAQARLLINDFEQAWEEHHVVRKTDDSAARGELEIILPPTLANYSNYSGIWIQHSYIEGIGLASGSLGLVVAENPSPGELAAIRVKETGEVSCGVYDEMFGIVGLTGDAEEPILFDESAITVLGRVVGVCRDDAPGSGRVIAQPLSIASDRPDHRL